MLLPSYVLCVRDKVTLNEHQNFNANQFALNFLSLSLSLYIFSSFFHFPNFWKIKIINNNGIKLVELFPGTATPFYIDNNNNIRMSRANYNRIRYNNVACIVTVRRRMAENKQNCEIAIQLINPKRNVRWSVALFEDSNDDYCKETESERKNWIKRREWNNNCLWGKIQF